jgi:HPt (histidine-containing phosphotransfer) domain-containing protein
MPALHSEDDVALEVPAPFDGHPPSAARTRAAARARFDNDAVFYARIVPMFEQAATEQARSLVLALGRRDAPLAAHLAHTLKGSLLTVGAMEAAIRAERVERAALQEAFDGLLVRAMQLSAETAIIVAQLSDPAAARD